MKTKLLVAACASALNQSDNRLVLIPEGQFSGLDGRPHDAPYWKLTAERGRQIALALNNRAIDLVIDYEHGTLKSQTDGKPAPASGWIKSFEYVDGVGLCSSDFKWTAQAQGFIDAEEYKYLSPVFSYTPAGDITGLLCVALTNTPNLDELPALLAAAAQDLFIQNSNEDDLMPEFLKLMLKKLGLAENATEAEVLTAANSFFAKVDAAGFGTELAKEQTLNAAVDAVIVSKTAANNQQPDPSKFVPIAVVTGLQQQIATLSANSNKTEIDTLYTAACSNGQLLGEHMQAWGRKLADDQPEEFKKFVASAPKIAALNGKQTDGTNVAANNQQQQETKHTPEALHVANLMGVELGATS
ncbi:phage protease [Acinetobacter piscicola]|uniref:phage protease n=1 Tax=Acinetobacter piscicola TaxID=2006115 RepID=UPI003555C444